MTKTFVYKKADGTEAIRKVEVIAEDKDYIRGIDLTKLNDDVAKKVVATLDTRKADEKVLFGKGTGPTIEGFEKDWNVAWRTFHKKNIVKFC